MRYKTKRGIPIHRAIGEQTLGRKMTRHEVVHHVDGMATAPSVHAGMRRRSLHDTNLQ